MTPFKKAVITAVSKIPPGKITSFGRISRAVGGSAQSVGWVLTGLSIEESKGIPWHRVVNSQGYITALKLGPKGQLQKTLLLEEGYKLEGDKVVLLDDIWYE